MCAVSRLNVIPLSVGAYSMGVHVHGVGVCVGQPCAWHVGGSMHMSAWAGLGVGTARGWAGIDVSNNSR